MQESATLIGFSDGAIISFVFGANYPTLTYKIVALAGGFGSNWFHKEALNSMKELTGEGLQKQYPDFVNSKKKLMPEPERWNEFITELNKVNMQTVFITDEKAKSISCPVLILGGDRDDYFRIDNFIHVFKTLPNSQLAIVPQTGHLDLMSKKLVFNDLILPFILNDKLKEKAH